LLPGVAQTPSRLAFSRLFDLLNLPKAELAALLLNLRAAQDAALPPESKPNAPAANRAAPLLPQDVDQLVWLGLSARSIDVLRPFITLLPRSGTPVNLNTAPAEVIYASVPRFTLADAHQFVSRRNLSHFAALAKANEAYGQSVETFNPAQHGVSSDYFEVLGQLRIDQTTVQERALVQRQGLDVSTLWRQRSALRSMPPLQ
jgi:general secretion pathway protein K